MARRHNLAPVDEAAEAPSQWLGSMDKSKWREVMVGTVERAYQLAPECSTFDELRARLVKEHCTNVDAHLQGSLRKELSKLLKKKSETD